VSAAERLLGRLKKVRNVAPGRWMACCPSHLDKTASLSIRELDDGRVLIHDFAGCCAEDLALGKPLSPEDRATLAATVGRIQAVAGMV